MEYRAAIKSWKQATPNHEYVAKTRCGKFAAMECRGRPGEFFAVPRYDDLDYPEAFTVYDYTKASELEYSDAVTPLGPFVSQYERPVVAMILAEGELAFLDALTSARLKAASARTPRRRQGRSREYWLLGVLLRHPRGSAR